jgi:hypothetical protein
MTLIYQGYREGSDLGTSFPAMQAIIELKADGTVSLDTARCQADGTGSWQTTTAGGWSFQAQGLADVRCPSPLVATDVDRLLTGLAQATTWSNINDPNILGPVYIFPAGAITLLFQTPADAAWSAPERPLAPPLPASPPSADPTSLIGDWRVEELAVATNVVLPDPAGGETVSAERSGPFDWPIKITADRIELPKGCNTGTGDFYLAAADGRWWYGGDLARTAMFCMDSTLMQSEYVDGALAWARSWDLPQPDRLVLEGPGSQLTLIRS